MSITTEVSGIIYDPEEGRVLVKKLDHGFRLLRGTVGKHETNRMALRREIREGAGLGGFTIIEALGTYAYLAEDGSSTLVNVYLVHASMYAEEPGGSVFWLRAKDASTGLVNDERAFLMRALGVRQPQPAVQVIDMAAARKPMPAVHFLRKPSQPGGRITVASSQPTR